MKIKHLGKLCLLVLASVAAFLIATPGMTGNNEEETTTQTPASETKSDDVETGDLAGVKAATDEDGNLRPLTKEESKELDRQLRKTLSKYKKHGPKKNSDGAVSLVVAPQSVELTVLSDGPEGSSVQCMTAEELAAAAANTEKAEEE